MKNLFLALSTVALAASATAAPIDTVALKNYARKSLQRCPDPQLDLQPMQQAGPRNFVLFTVQLRSSDEACGAQKYMLFSPTTQQILLGTVLRLPADSRPVNQRIADHASSLLKTPLTATIAPFPLPDGLRSVAMTKQTDHGPFSYNGFVDASEQFLIVGMRGNLQQEPAASLISSLNAGGLAVRRGNAKSKVEIIEISDFQCPTCARAHKKVEPLIAKNLDKILYTRIDLPLFEHHEWSIPAAMGARAINKVAPAKYWQYVDYVFNNQEQIGKQPFDQVFKGWVEDHDLTWSAIEPHYRSKTERAALLAQVSRAFDAGINSTPTFIVNGQQVGFGPEGTFTVETIRAAIASAGGSVPAAKAPAKKSAAKKKK